MFVTLVVLLKNKIFFKRFKTRNIYVMNNITLAHMGGEIVVIAGMAFYFHKKTGNLQTQVEELKKQNIELREAVEQLSESLNQLGAMFMQLNNGGQPQSFLNPNIQDTSKVAQRNVSAPRRPKQSSVVLPPKKKKVQKKVLSDDSGDETLDDAFLDKELEKETNEYDCEGEMCMLKD